MFFFYGRASEQVYPGATQYIGMRPFTRVHWTW